MRGSPSLLDHGFLQIPLTLTIIKDDFNVDDDDDGGV